MDKEPLQRVPTCAISVRAKRLARGAGGSSAAHYSKLLSGTTRRGGTTASYAASPTVGVCVCVHQPSLGPESQHSRNSTRGEEVREGDGDVGPLGSCLQRHYKARIFNNVA